MIINPATGVLARYYHRYAAFLAEHGFTVLTYDYRGIGLSRDGSLRGKRYSWRDWGERDLDAVIRFAEAQALTKPLAVVAHSIGGVLIGYAPNANRIDRILTVGAQYAYWRDYRPDDRLRLLWRWHVVMPILAMLCGYFPGRRLGWLEDLPAPIAREWALRRARLEASQPIDDRDAILGRFAAVRAPILACSMTDDPFGTLAALTRALAYFSGAARHVAMLEPARFGEAAIGHFAPFHDRFRETLWRDMLVWLRDGRNPWPDASSPQVISTTTLPRARPVSR